MEDAQSDRIDKKPFFCLPAHIFNHWNYETDLYLILFSGVWIEKYEMLNFKFIYSVDNAK